MQWIRPSWAPVRHGKAIRVRHVSVYRLLARSSWHFYRRHPAQLILSILGIVLGVAIVTAVLITNSSSQRAFALSSEALYGRTTHQLTGARGLDERVYVTLHRQLPALRMAPIIQGHVIINEQVFSLLGIDPFSEAGFGRTQALAAASTGNPAIQQLAEADQSAITTLLQPNALLASQATLDERSLAIGQSLQLAAGGRQFTATLAGTFASSNPAASTGVLMGDIAFVQSVLQRGTRIDRIDLILEPDEVAQLRRLLPENVQLSESISRQQTMRAMTRGFHINLTAMSMLALVVGVFLIHNTMTFAVVQRRELFAIKRITGITARTVLVSILTEAFAISLVGSLLGLLLGYGVAHGLIKLTTQTINDLYFVLHVQQIWFSPWLVVVGLVLGIGSSVLAASLSAIDAAATSPVQARQRSLIEQRTHRWLPLFACTGLIIALAGLVLAWVPSQSLVLGFAALMLLILGYGLTLPWLTSRGSRLLQPLAARAGINTSLAVAGIERNISRTGLAIAALSIAVSATFGVDVMIGSFRSTVDQWLGTTLQSDIYVTAPSAGGSQGNPGLRPGLEDIARSTHGVSSVSTGRSMDVSSSAGEIEMLVVDTHEKSEAGFELIHGDASVAWPQWQSSDAVMISEPLATKHQLGVGDSITIFTELEGDTAFTVVAVFRDFGSSHGKILMARSLYNRFWSDRDVGTLGVLLTDTQLSDQVISAFEKTLSTPQRPLIIQSNTRIHQQSLAVFDRTFEVTRVLRWLTVGVAFVGIFSALLALHLERAREFAIIRAAGATRAQIMQIVSIQTLTMGLFAGLLALPLGWLMSVILIHVINVRSFGWTMQSMLPQGSIPDTLFMACLSAVLAGIYPAWRLSRTPIASQLRDD